MNKNDFSFYKGKRVLVTGGLGFLGSNLAIRLVECGAEPTLLDNFQADHGANWFNIDPVRDRVQVNICDIRDRAALDRLVRGQDIIVHIAAQTSHLDSMIDPLLDVDINCAGTLHLLEAISAHNPQARVVYACTRAVYGKPAESPAKETTLLDPIDIYGVNKYAAEVYMMLYHRHRGLHTVSLRLSNGYGPRAQIQHPKYGILNWFIGQAVQNKELKVFGDGSQLRDYTYIEDQLDAFMLAGMRDEAIGRVYNVGSEQPVKFVEMVETLIDVAGSGSYKKTPWPDANKAIEVGDFVADSSKIRSELGWKPNWSLRDGLAESAAFYREHLERYL